MWPLGALVVDPSRIVFALLCRSALVSFFRPPPKLERIKPIPALFAHDSAPRALRRGPIRQIRVVAAPAWHSAVLGVVRDERRVIRLPPRDAPVIPRPVR